LKTLKIEWVPIERLFPNPANPRHNDAAVPHVQASIRRFGWQQPIVVKQSGEIIAGHTRYLAAKELGQDTVPVVWFDGTDLDAPGYAIADNRTHEFATWDDAALSKILTELQREDALEGVGYSDEDLDKLISELEDTAGPRDLDDPGPEPPPVKPVSRTGDLWVLGDHRLLCGDSTNAVDVARLLGNDRPVLLSTDPPYCVRYTGANRPIHDGKSSGKDWSHVYREVDIDDLGTFLTSVLEAWLPRIDERAPLYVWHAHTQQPVIAAVFSKFKILFHQVIVWCKPTPVFTHCYYQWQHEVCAFGWRQGMKPEHGVAQYSTTWHMDWEGKSRVVGNEHPTQKPLQIFGRPIELHTHASDVIAEPFSGSGSQLLAAEMHRRKCRAMEVSPAFVDVAVKRWQVATGKQAILDGEGRTFDIVTAERLGA
jgi:DNA modification methylase